MEPINKIIKKVAGTINYWIRIREDITYAKIVVATSVIILGPIIIFERN